MKGFIEVEIIDDETRKKNKNKDKYQQNSLF